MQWAHPCNTEQCPAHSKLSINVGNYSSRFRRLRGVLCYHQVLLKCLSFAWDLVNASFSLSLWASCLWNLELPWVWVSYVTGLLFSPKQAFLVLTVSLLLWLFPCFLSGLWHLIPEKGGNHRAFWAEASGWVCGPCSQGPQELRYLCPVILRKQPFPGF